MCKQLRFSIRKINEDEIEIRNSFFDGYTRGFIRLLFIGIFCMSWYQNAKYKQPPFSYEIAAIKEDFVWAFNPDKKIYLPYIERRTTERVRAYFHPIWMAFLLFLFCLPRPRGIRVNRKKRIIYAPILNGTYRVAFVPKEGDPLGGVVYSCYGPHPWGGDSLHSLTISIQEEKNMLPSRHHLGVYPSVSSTQSSAILQAIRAYLTEENPEFLKHIKRRFSVWHYIVTIPFCNAFALPMPFNRGKADTAIEQALAEWNKKTNNQKQKWFKDIAEEQKIINEELAIKGLDNHTL